MKKGLIALATSASMAAIFLAGCSPNYDDKSGDYYLPPELKDCKIYRVSNGMNVLFITRCPKSETSTNWVEGKTRVNSVTISE